MVESNWGNTDEENEDVDGETPLEVSLDAEGRIAGVGGQLNFDFRSFDNAVSLSKTATAGLIRDAQAIFGTEETFFLNCTSNPRCTFEQMARDVFNFHTSSLQEGDYNPETSGAEWWVQVREKGEEKESIGMHWDKDEDLVDSQGINLHPQISTVTYLSDWGAPTLVLSRTAPSLYQDQELGAFHGPIPGGHLSFPRSGKHISFDGRLLHGAPAVTSSTPPETSSGSQRSRNSNEVRVTFLVNIWLNYQPCAAQRFPEDELWRLKSPKVNLNLSSSSLSSASLDYVVRASKRMCEPVATLSGACFKDVKRKRGDSEGIQSRSKDLLRGMMSSSDCKQFTFFFGPGGCEHELKVPLPKAVLNLTETDARCFNLEFSRGSMCQVGSPDEKKNQKNYAKQ